MSDNISKEAIKATEQIGLIIKQDYWITDAVQIIQSAIDQSTAAMRDELERVNSYLAETSARCIQYRSQLADQSAKMASLESQIGDQRNHLEWFGNDFVAIEKALNGESSDALCRLAQKAAVVVKQRTALESQAGAMREALEAAKLGCDNDVWQCEICGHTEAMADADIAREIKHALSSNQAGADLLKREQALRDALGWLLSFVGQAPQKDYAAFLSKHVPVGSFTSMDELEGKLNECIGKGWSAIASKDAALSQEQATPRNG